MLNANFNATIGYSSNLLFMRRRQVADLLISLAEGPMESTQAKNLLLDALYQLPTHCFIADDWYVILKQVTETLLQQEAKNGARMPTALNRLISKLSIRLADHTH